MQTLICKKFPPPPTFTDKSRLCRKTIYVGLGQESFRNVWSSISNKYIT